MLDEQTLGHTARSISLTEYAADLARCGTQVLMGAPGTLWTRHESGAMMRRPTFHTGPLASNELREVLWRGRAAIASYLLEPDEDHPANAWLYLCTDHSYAPEKLDPAMRRNVRRGLRELTIAPLSADEVLAHGVQAFCDTRRCVGLSDGTPEAFQRHFTTYLNLPQVVFLGAWKDNQLAAFLSITQVDD